MLTKKLKNMDSLKKNGRINWKHDDNKKCLDLIAWGFSLNRIQQETGLTPGKIMYRARMKNIKIGDFRNGVGPKAIVLLSKFRVKSRGA